MHAGNVGNVVFVLQVCIVKSGAKQERCLRARIVRLFNSQVGKQAT